MAGAPIHLLLTDTPSFPCQTVWCGVRAPAINNQCSICVSLYKGTASLETPGERPESLSITLTQGSSGSEFRVSAPSTISAPSVCHFTKAQLVLKPPGRGQRVCPSPSHKGVVTRGYEACCTTARNQAPRVGERDRVDPISASGQLIQKPDSGAGSSRFTVHQ